MRKPGQNVVGQLSIFIPYVAEGAKLKNPQEKTLRLCFSFSGRQQIYQAYTHTPRNGWDMLFLWLILLVNTHAL